jgi:conjugative transfer signal peptidase TraF
MKMNKKTKLKLVGGFSAALLAALTGLYQAGYRYNSTPSYPIGIYKVDAADLEVQRGRLILICPPDTKFFRKANAKGYVAKGFCPNGYEPLIKKIAGVPGDHIVVDGFVFINGKKQPKSKVYNIDPQGYKLVHTPKKEYHLGNDQIFLLSDFNDKSFDSRYFGPVSANLIQGTITPVKVW